MDNEKKATLELPFEYPRFWRALPTYQSISSIFSISMCFPQQPKKPLTKNKSASCSQLSRCRTTHLPALTALRHENDDDYNNEDKDNVGEEDEEEDDTTLTTPTRM